jgi:hypothetical protein
MDGKELSINQFLFLFYKKKRAGVRGKSSPDHKSPGKKIRTQRRTDKP